jgi:hypothetical protein
MSNLVSTDLSAENTYTPGYDVGVGDMPIFIQTYGTWAGTITIQIKAQGDTTFRDIHVERYTGNFNRKASDFPINSQVRAGFKSGEYTSGTATIQITQ